MFRTAKWFCGPAQRPAPTASFRLHFQILRKPRQVAKPRAGHHNQIFEPNTSQTGVVKSGFDGHNMTSPERRTAARAEARQLVDLQANTVTGPVKEALHASLLNTCLKSSSFELLEDRLVNGVAADTGLNLRQRQ